MHTLLIVAGAAIVSGLLMYWLAKLGVDGRAWRAFPAELEDLIGQEGVARSILTPSGIVMINEKRVHAISEGDVIERGSRVVVVAVRAGRVIVRTLP